MRRWFGSLATTVTLAAGFAGAQGLAPASTTPSLSGIYQTIADDVVLPGRLRNSGSPDKIELIPSAAQQSRTANLAEDPAKLCQPLGPFRMMARPKTKIEFVPVRGSLVMMFEDVAHGQMRTVHLNRSHLASSSPSWLGDSVGRWEGGILVIDTVGFNDRTWLNDAGAQHSDALHLVEKIRPILDGKYLEYQITADDAKALARPYTYTRYFEKFAGEVMEDVCEY